jgi:MFS family permease
VLFGNLAITVPPMIIYFALPDMMRAFSGEDRIRWVATAPQMASAGTMMTTWLVRRFRQRVVYVASALLLIAGSVVGALADLCGRRRGPRRTERGSPDHSVTMVHRQRAARAAPRLGMTIWGVGLPSRLVITPIVGGLLVKRSAGARCFWR